MLSGPFWLSVRYKHWRKTYMEVRPTTNMKKGWLCRTSRDEKNHDITPVMMIHQWLSRSSDDIDPVMMIQQWWSRSSDDPNLVMMSNDDPDPMMKMTWRWRWPEYKDDLKMKMNWRQRWIDDDPDDTEKNTCVDKLCQENTFLVKRECWCICNFGMYFTYISYIL